MEDEFLDRDSETLLLQKVYSRTEAQNLIDFLKTQQELQVFEARNLAELLETTPLESLDGKLSICIFLEILSPQVRDSLSEVFDDVLTTLWEHSKQLNVLYMNEPA